jgi:hypothetical protein
MVDAYVCLRLLTRKLRSPIPVVLWSGHRLSASRCVQPRLPLPHTQWLRILVKPLANLCDQLAVVSTPPVVRLWTSTNELWIVAPHDAPAEFDLTSLCLLDQFASCHPVDDRNHGRATLRAQVALAGCHPKYRSMDSWCPNRPGGFVYPPGWFASVTRLWLKRVQGHSVPPTPEPRQTFSWSYRRRTAQVRAGSR